MPSTLDLWSYEQYSTEQCIQREQAVCQNNPQETLKTENIAE